MACPVTHKANMSPSGRACRDLHVCTATVKPQAAGGMTDVAPYLF